MGKDDLVLLDTNVIIEINRLGILNALAGGIRLGTVEKCIEETRTGEQNRDPSYHIDENKLRDKFEIFEPTEDDILTASLQIAGLAEADLGEKHLLTQAFKMSDQAWLMASPDKNAMKIAIDAGWRDKLISLQNLAGKVGQGKVSFRENYTERWHADTCFRFVF